MQGYTSSYWHVVYVITQAYKPEACPRFWGTIAALTAEMSY